MSPRTLDRDLAFEMALHADVIAPGRWKFGGIDYYVTTGGLIIVGLREDMRRFGTVAALARDSAVSERRLRVTILGAR